MIYARARAASQLLPGLAASAIALAALVAACGPATTETHETPPPMQLPSASASSAPSAAPSASAPPATVFPPPPPRAPGEKNTSVQRSSYDDKLRALGFDPAHLPELEKLNPDDKRKLMPFFVETMGFIRSEGGGCSNCHEGRDFAKKTRETEIVREMWDRWVVKMEIAGGGNVFCDSCHEHKRTTLDRGDAAALRKFMKAEYTGKLALRDDQSGATCATCHARELELDIYDKVWHVPAENGGPAAPSPAPKAAK